jgi:alpha-amylase
MKWQPRLLLGIVAMSAAMARGNVILQGFYWNVPSGYGSPWWWDHLADQANAFALDGFSEIWIPPVLKCASGGFSVGYDPFDDYDIGSKNQKGTIPTHYGTREQLERCCAMLKANGIGAYCDMVNNHRDGDSGNWIYTYPGAYGYASTGRFPKGFYDFHPNVPQDPDVPDGSGENFNAFGRDLAPINGLPKNQIYNGLNAAGDWLTKALDLDGYRLDDVPGISTEWLLPYLNYGSLAGKFAVGEYYDSNLSDVENWINQMEDRASALDYPLRDGYLKTMCNSPSSFNMASLDHAGVAGEDPFHSVTFVENQDTDRSEPITQNKALAYAYILTSEGYPCVFYRDYSLDSGCYGMKAVIDPLIWIHEHLASGITQQRWENNLVFVYERMGGKHLLIGLNNNVGYDYKLNCATGFGPNVHLHDYTGNATDVYTDSSGNVALDLPPAINGLGYCAYAPVGITGAFKVNPLTTTQEYAGAIDLDIPPADPDKTNEICRIDSDGQEPVSEALFFDATDWTAYTSVTLKIIGPSGEVEGLKTYNRFTAQGAVLTASHRIQGWYTFEISAVDTPKQNPRPAYRCRVTYRGPRLSAASP